MELVGQFAGLCAAWVHDHHPAATALECLESPTEVRHGHQAAVGGHRIGANADEQVGAVDVRYREENLVPEHFQAGQHVGQLVVGGGGEPVLGTQGPEEWHGSHQRAVIVYVGVAEVSANTVAAVLFAYPVQSAGHQVKGFVPLHFLPAVGGAPYRFAQALRVFVEVLEGDGLGADVAMAQRIVLVTLDGGDVAILDLDGHAAHGFTQMAGTVVGAVFHGVSPNWLLLF